MNNQKIIPHLWFDNQVEEATAFYTKIFPESKIINSLTLSNTPAGDTKIVEFSIYDYKFLAINGGSQFKFNPSISFNINFYKNNNINEEAELRKLWSKLIKGGKALMPLQKYPFSKLYGWVEDKYGLTWQLILFEGEPEIDNRIITNLLFTKDVCGKAEEATDYYISVFKESERDSIHYYPAGLEPDQEGTVMFSHFTLEDQDFSAVDSARDHDFTFNEAISLYIDCDSQQEIDYYWEKLSHDPKSEVCGWLKDKYGVFWQVSSSKLTDYMAKADKDELERITQKFLKMKKIQLDELIES